MFGFHYLILNLFSWFAFLSPQNELGTGAMPQSSFEVVISAGHKQSPAVIELGSYPIELLDTSQNSKLPFVCPFDGVQKANNIAYEPKLLYYQIGNAIELELTSTTIIFPFHCFT
ncbi:MAG: hypothetical protein R2783_01550 [Gelidibacter sp.]